MGLSFFKKVFRPGEESEKPISEETLRSNRLVNVLGMAHDLVGMRTYERNREVYHETAPLFYLIKLLTQHITLNSAVHCIENFGTDTPLKDGPDSPSNAIQDLLFHPNDNQLRQRIYSDIYSCNIVGSVSIDLANDPVLAFPWITPRITRALKNIGKDTGNPWTEDLNHILCLYLPIGVVEFMNGRHSGFCGAFKHEGHISISADSQHQIIDFSKLYEYLRFDGTNYILTETNTVAGRAKSFEFGCLFEIGRMMNECEIAFKNIYLAEKHKG